MSVMQESFTVTERHLSNLNFRHTIIGIKILYFFIIILVINKYLSVLLMINFC